MDGNTYLSYVFQRFWIVDEGRFVNATSINSGQRYITDKDSSKMYHFVGASPKALWVMPTFIKDANNRMMFRHDIVEYIGERYMIDFIEGYWYLVDSKGKTQDELPDAADECEVVGNMFESASKLTEYEDK